MARDELRREQAPESRLLLWTADWLTTLLLSVGMVFPCLSAYGVSGQRDFDFGAVLVFCVFGSLCAAAMFTWRHGYWAALGVLAAEGLAFWSLWARLAEDWNRVRPPGLSDLLSESPGALFLLYILAVLALGWAVVRVRAWWLAAALAVFPVLPAIQSGVLPSWGAMLAGFAGWGAMLLTGLFSRRDYGSLARARYVSLGGMAALILVLVMALPMEGYTRPQWATGARNSLLRGLNRQLERFFDAEELENNLLVQLGLDLRVDGAGTDAGPGQGIGPGAAVAAGSGTGRREDLLNLGPRSYTGRMLLSVGTDQPNPAGRIYLKGGSYGEYTGTSWESGAQAVFRVRPEAFPLQAVPGLPEYTLRVRDISFRGTWYYPYRYSGGGTMDGDGFLTLGRDENAVPPEELSTEGYQIPYSPGGPEDGFTPLSGQWAEDEASYRDNTAVTCLPVPDGLQSVLEPLVEEVRRETVAIDERLPEQFREPVASAARTAKWLASAAAYDPDAPAMEEGEDFVLHFLEEKRGFCVHFATAGAMLLRMQGIPARYVSGYVAALDRQGWGAVRDSDAHAWVEIYLDGYGWYPVEMTPGYTGGISGAGLENASGAPAAPGPEDPEENETPEEEAPDPEEPDGEAPGEEAPEDGVPPDGEAAEDGKGVALPWKVLSAIAVFWGALCAAYLLAQLARRRAGRDRNTNRSVLNAYGRYRRLRRWGCGEDDELERLAKKAKFSQHTLTEEERESAWKCLNEDLKQSQVGQPLRRRWLLALLCPLF